MKPQTQRILADKTVKAIAHFHEVAKLSTTGPRYKDADKAWWKAADKLDSTAAVVRLLDGQKDKLCEIEAALYEVTRKAEAQRERVKFLTTAASLALDVEAAKVILDEALAEGE